MADAKSERNQRIERPLSPHLQIYRPLINMVMSIIHRITGVALYFGTLLLVWWLTALATGPEYFNMAAGVFGSLPGLVVLIGFTWALMHHMLGGLRHLVWDTGRGFELATIDRMSWGTIIGSLLLTAAIWATQIPGVLGR